MSKNCFDEADPRGVIRFFAYEYIAAGIGCHLIFNRAGFFLYEGTVPRVSLSPPLGIIYLFLALGLHFSLS